MRRRTFFQNSALLAAGNLLWSSTTRATTGHNAYFARLNEILKREGPGRPVMLIDTERMNYNIDALSASVGDEKTYRIVVKSLPSVPLLDHVAQHQNLDRRGTEGAGKAHHRIARRVSRDDLILHLDHVVAEDLSQAGTQGEVENATDDRARSSDRGRVEAEELWIDSPRARLEGWTDSQVEKFEFSRVVG